MKQIFSKITAGLLAAVLLLCTLSGCVRRTAEKPSFRVMTSFYPVYIMAVNITNGIDGVQVSDMAGQQTGCLHDYQLQSSDMQALSSADLFIINGAG
ncbi:MAG: zinc ABC transporter substrate-binding protein, partial [Ruminococcaceae bacterium]|nr:zinc ABC transporter substrate-binding protein [Oscillospiraceae bacterium]